MRLIQAQNQVVQNSVVMKGYNITIFQENELNIKPYACFSHLPSTSLEFFSPHLTLY